VPINTNTKPIVEMKAVKSTSMRVVGKNTNLMIRPIVKRIVPNFRNINEFFKIEQDFNISGQSLPSVPNLNIFLNTYRNSSINTLNINGYSILLKNH
jgi:hypothetical protein